MLVLATLAPSRLGFDTADLAVLDNLPKETAPVYLACETKLGDQAKVCGVQTVWAHFASDGVVLMSW